MPKVLRTSKNNFATETELIELGATVIDNLNELKEAQLEAQWRYESLNSKFDDKSYDEDFEDTLTRKYEEGFADALAYALRLIGKGN